MTAEADLFAEVGPEPWAVPVAAVPDPPPTYTGPWARALGSAVPSLYFTGRSLTELLAARLTRDVLANFGAGRTALGPGGLWAYEAGVWSAVPDEVISAMVFRMVGDKYRPGHVSTVLHAIRAQADMPTLSAHPSDGWSGMLNFGNGLLDWRTGTMSAHTPECLSTWQLPYDYDPEATCPRWLAFLAEVLPADMLAPLPGSGGVAPWQEDLGYLLLAGNPLHCAFLHRGSGRNGKGVYMSVSTALIGAKHCSGLSLEDMVDGSRKFRLHELVGSALNVCGEVDPRFLASTAAFKGITGGDPLTIERKFKEPFVYTPFATPVFSANEDFAAVDRSTAYFDRWQIRAFPNYIPPERRDPRLAGRIIASELPGIAALAVAGLRSLMARGHFVEVESSRVQKATFRKHSDHLIRWFEEGLVFGPSEEITRSALSLRYRAWCEEENVRPLGASKVYKALVEHGAKHDVEVEPFMVRGDRKFRGVGDALGPMRY